MSVIDPFAIINLIPDATGFGLDLAANLDLERLVTLQHVDRDSHATGPAQAQLVRDASPRLGIITGTERTAGIRPTG